MERAGLRVVGVLSYAVETGDSVVVVVPAGTGRWGDLMKRSFGRNVDDIETFLLWREVVVILAHSEMAIA
jgi:hypothetical protein